MFKNLNTRIKKLSVWDLGIFKICLLSIGMIFGSLFSVFVKETMVMFIIIAVVTYIVVLARVFRK